MNTYYKVHYDGFLQRVERYFYIRERAEQWIRQVGKYQATVTEDTGETCPVQITQETSDYYPLTIQ